MFCLFVRTKLFFFKFNSNCINKRLIISGYPVGSWYCYYSESFFFSFSWISKCMIYVIERWIFFHCGQLSLVFLFICIIAISEFFHNRKNKGECTKLTFACTVLSPVDYYFWFLFFFSADKQLIIKQCNQNPIRLSEKNFVFYETIKFK